MAFGSRFIPVSLLCLALSAAAGSPPQAAQTALDEIDAAYREHGNHLIAVQALRALARRYQDSPDATHLVFQRLGWHESYVGNETEAVRLFTRHLFGNRLPSWQAGPPPDGSTAMPLRERIAELAGEQQLLLINEAHHVSRHRITTRRLLAPLHAAGFRYLALEAMKESGKALAARGYPVASSGTYLNDPEFAQLVREALMLGFTLVEYDPINTYGQERETQQAANIAAILERDPEARILVHAGYQHIDETGLLFGARTMAQLLHEMTGIDPLTLNQTTLQWIGDELEPNDVYAAAMKLAGDIAEPFVLVKDGKPWSVEPGRHDVTVITPPTILHESGRPGWLFEAAGMHAVRMRVPVGARLVEARLAGEPREAVPVDRIEIDETDAVTLALVQGDYRITWHDASGEAFKEEKLRVSGNR